MSKRRSDLTSLAFSCEGQLGRLLDARAGVPGPSDPSSSPMPGARHPTPVSAPRPARSSKSPSGWRSVEPERPCAPAARPRGGSSACSTSARRLVVDAALRARRRPRRRRSGRSAAQLGDARAEVAARRPRRRARRSAAASATRSCSAASRRRPASTSARARSASSSQASAASRPPSSAARRSCGRSAALAAASRGRAEGQLERAAPSARRRPARPRRSRRARRAPARGATSRTSRVGGRGAVQVQHAVERGDRGRGLGLAVDAREPARAPRPASANGARGDERRAGRATGGGAGCGAVARGAGAAARGRRRRARRASRARATCVGLTGVPAQRRSGRRPGRAPTGTRAGRSRTARSVAPWAPCWRARRLTVERVLRRLRRRPSGSRSCRGGR